MKAANVGIFAAEEATKTGLIALLTGSAAAVSATGIGLVAGGAALSVVTSMLALRSAVKTNRHVLVLQKLYNGRRGDEFKQNCIEILRDGTMQHTRWCQISHEIVAEHVLPYIIHKKTSKYIRKSVTGIVPIAGALSITGFGAVKKLYKLARGTAGVNRKNAAGWLAEHFCRCDCVLANSIVSALYSIEEMKRLREEWDYNEIADCLAQKMQST